MLRIIVTLCTCFTTMVLLAQSDTVTSAKKEIHVSGSADLYYRYNFETPLGSLNNYTKFTNSQNSFELGMASLKAEDTAGKVSATINLGFGNRTEEYSYITGNTISSAIKELFISYAVSDKIHFTVGKWYKHFGYESADAYQNKNYSMSYAFSFSPMFFTGLKTNIALSKQIELMAGIANPADFVTTTSQTKTIIGSLAYHSTSNRFSIRIGGQGYSGISSPYQPAPQYQLYKKLLQLDLVAQYKFSNSFDIAFNNTYLRVNDGEKKDMNSSVLYLKWNPNRVTEISFRNEYLVDKNDALKIGTNVFASTLSAGFKINKSLVIMPEIRFDEGSNRIFQKQDFSGTKQTFTALAAIVYSF